MDKILGENWKTTLGGILSAVGLALVGLETLPEKYKWVGPIMAAIGAALVGATAKDFNVHSTEGEIKASTEIKVAEKEVEALKEKK